MPEPVHHLYLHVPFCAKVCPYCAFYVHGGSAGLQKRFAAALAAELRHARTAHRLRAVSSVYFGGGTPSMLNADLFGQIAEAMAELDLAPGAEITLEANPATVTEAKARAWRAAGVNRISLGAQSFDPAYLKLLGRQHRPEDIPETVAALRAHGFGNLNLDLMFALPGMPEATWRRTVEAALACGPDHVSAYALTYEEDTPFFERLRRGDWTLGEADEAREIAMFNWTRERLAAAGRPAYEISNFARPGCESLHNRAYWTGRDYLGLGPGAWSTVGARRWRNLPNTEAYIEAVGAGKFARLRTEGEAVEPATRTRERVMFGLRTREGVTRELIGRLGPEGGQALDEALRERLIEPEVDRFVLTSRGRLVADSVAAMFV
ncbi:MAG: radical SAM family heme chaperone HemW [Verrucomicrobiota bacterium]